MDWIVQSRIKDSLEQVNRQLAVVGEILQKLRKQVDETEDAIDQLVKEKRGLIERA